MIVSGFRRPVPRRFVVLFVAAAFGVFGQDSFDGVERIVAVGDVHGGFHEFVRVLGAAGVIDESHKWSGGKTHLVQTGDVPDRGPDTRKVLDLLMDLEKQARKAGGRVHALIGNHEAMNIYGDLRYVSPAEFEAFRTPRSEQTRREHAERLTEREPGRAEALAKWEQEHPLGWVEHRQAYQSGRYGRWILGHKAVIRINDVLFLHAGMSPKYAQTPLSGINRRVQEELKDFGKLEGGMVMDPEGPLWYRGLAQEPEEGLAAHVDAVLRHFQVSRIVLGHTVQKEGIRTRFGGKVVLIDTGLSALYGGPLECLVIEKGKLSVAGDKARPIE